MLSCLTIECFFKSATKYDLPSFIEKCFDTINPGIDYIPNWHIDLIADRLQAAEKGKIKRLIINIPPRYLKSLCVNIAWSAWLLGHNPTRRVISASYSQAIATKHSLDTRLIIESNWYQKTFPETIITHDQNEKDKFITTKRGFRLATSVGGSLTGEGGDFLIIDDPHNPVNIMSRIARDATSTWYEQVFASRLDNKKKGVIILIMQRLHEEDLTGFLIKKSARSWHHLKIPAIAEKNITYHFLSNYRIAFRYNEGQCLHEKRESLDNLKAIKEELGSHTFGSQYLQNPMPADSGMVKQSWIKRYSTPQNPLQLYQSWDCAIKSAAVNDYSVATTWAENDNSYNLINVERVKLEYPDLKRLIINLYEKYKPQAVLIEDKASGQMLIQELKKETKIPVIGINPTIDKISRFAAVTALFEAGRVKLPQSAEWLLDYETELFSFPKATNDDQIDSTSQFLNWVKNQVITEPRIRRI